MKGHNFIPYLSDKYGDFSLKSLPIKLFQKAIGNEVLVTSNFSLSKNVFESLLSQGHYNLVCCGSQMSIPALNKWYLIESFINIMQEITGTYISQSQKIHELSNTDLL